MHIDQFIAENQARAKGEWRSTVQACVAVVALLLAVVAFAKNAGWL